MVADTCPGDVLVHMYVWTVMATPWSWCKLCTSCFWPSLDINLHGNANPILLDPSPDTHPVEEWLCILQSQLSHLECGAATQSSLEKPTAASIGCAIPMRSNKSGAAVHGCRLVVHMDML